MFRKMRRYCQEVSISEAKNILKDAGRGVLSVIGDNGYPYGVPVNYFYDENDNAIYIHGAKEGHKIDSLKKCSKVSFTTWNNGYKKDGDWAWTITSVIVFGQAELINDINVVTEKVRHIGLKYYPSSDDVEKEVESAIDRVQLICIHVEHITGKTINEK